MCRALGAAIATIIPGISKHFYSALRRQQSAKSATKTDGNNKQKINNSGSESEDKQDEEATTLTQRYYTHTNTIKDESEQINT